MATKQGNGNGEVGYGKPPLNTRFKKGHSGNSKGRPPGVKNLATIVRQLLNAKVSVRDNGRVRSITTREALIAQLVREGLRGNLRALELMFKIPLLQKEMADLEKSSPMKLEDWEQIAILVRGDLHNGDGSESHTTPRRQPDISEVASRLEGVIEARRP